MFSFSIYFELHRRSNMITELQKKHAQKEVNRALKNTYIDFRYKEGGFESSFEQEAPSGMSSWQEIGCTIDNISQVNQKKYPFAEVSEGDIVVLLPADTKLPLDKQSYEIDYKGSVYKCESKPYPYDVIQDVVLSYALVGELNA